MIQKPAHPVGSSGSRGLLQVGTSSSTRATHTSWFSRQSSQYRVALMLEFVVVETEVSVVNDVDGDALSGNNASPFKKAAMLNASTLIIGILDVDSIGSGSSFGITDVIGSPDVAFCSVKLSDDFRYCWMIWSFSGSAKVKKMSENRWRISHCDWQQKNSFFLCVKRRLNIYRAFGNSWKQNLTGDSTTWNKMKMKNKKYYIIWKN